MYFIIYVSSAVKAFSNAELLGLLNVCRENNAKLDVTGMLLYKDGNFMQALEGDEKVIKNLFRKICVDPRHKGVLALLEGEIQEREFSEWSMGFQILDSHEGNKTPAYNEFLNYPFTGEEFRSNPSLSQKLLLSFKKNMR